LSYLQFIGTSSALTSLKKFHSSFILSTKNFNLLIDTGDGSSRALLNQKIDFNSIDAILITHLHADHYCGLPSLLTQMKLLKEPRKKKILIIAHESILDVIQKFIFNSMVFEEKMGFKIEYKNFSWKKIFSINKKIKFLSKKNSHLNSNLLLKNVRKKKLSSSSFLFFVEKAKIFYTSDVGSAEDLYLFKDEKLDLLISESSHINYDDICIAEQKLNVKKFLLTHFTDEVENQIKKKISKNKNSKISLASDGQIINLS